MDRRITEVIASAAGTLETKALAWWLGHEAWSISPSTSPGDISTMAPSSASRVTWHEIEGARSTPAAPTDAGLPTPMLEGIGPLPPGTDSEDVSVPEPSTWIRLEYDDHERRIHKVLSKWHGVRGWDAARGQVNLLCTARDRNLSWALRDGRRYIVGRSMLLPRDGAICLHCRHRFSEQPRDARR